MLALTGCSGKLGGSTLHAILSYHLIPPTELVICTSSSISDERWNPYISKGIQIRSSSYDDPDSMVKAFSGCDRLLLVSSPHVVMDFGSAPYGEGREKHHFAALKAAYDAGVKHVYYTSLALGKIGGPDSAAGVMLPHLHTEAALKTHKFG
jgi:uncharacterized protein YbjT (DUF2867 family)